MTQILVELLHRNARMPRRARNGDSGFDVFSVNDVVVMPGETRPVPLSLRLSIPDGFEVQIRPRSGLSAAGLLVHFGTVDSGYRGPVSVVVTNLGASERAISANDRVAQFVVAPVASASFVDSDGFFTETERGEGGFGSTGR